MVGKKEFINIYQTLFEKEHSDPLKASLEIFEILYGEDAEIKNFGSEMDKCVSAKMSKMKNENRPQKQKIAIAFSYCKGK